MKKIQIYDTTLRDGAQAEGISFSLEDKIRITRRLDKIGVDYIEAGWPGSNPKDMAFFKRIQNRRFRHARLTAFCSTRRAGIAADEDTNLRCVLDSGVGTAAIFGKSWDFHVFRALNTTLAENLAMIRESVGFLKAHGLEVIFDAEHFFDGYKARPEYALAALHAAAEAGADTIALCDTNGGTMPMEIYEMVTAVRRELRTPLGIHAHNDSGVGVANSLMAVEAGAVQVQGTINGYGERCGNADLCAIIPNLTLKKGFTTIPRENLVYLSDLSRYVSELANLSPDSRQPYVGSSAFAHKGGIHVSALLKDVNTYEHIAPETVGNQRRVLVSELSGLSNLVYKYRELNVNGVESDDSRRFLSELKALEAQGFQFEGAEGSLELLLRKAYDDYRRPFVLEGMRLLTDMKDDHVVHSEAVIKMRVNDQVVHTAAEGNGPVNALDNALRKALEEFYPDIAGMKLNDYKVRVLDEKAGTEAVVRVLIETGDGRRAWGTVGVSSNIIEASWQALVDSLAYGILKLDEGDPAAEEEEEAL